MPKKKKSKVRNITQEEYERYILSLQEQSEAGMKPAENGEEQE